MNSSKPIIIITTGDPAGVGPEITIKSFLHNPDLLKSCVPIVIGNFSVLKKYSYRFSALKKLYIVNIDNINVGKIRFGKSNPNCGKAAIDYLNYAARLVQSCLSRNSHMKVPGAALVTAPVSKGAIIRGGIKFNGHTEYLARLTHTKEVAMMMVSRKLKVLLATRHIPLKDVSKNLSAELLVEQTKVACNTIRKYFKVNSPQVIMCNFNPHQGEDGYIGDEEKKIILPAMKKLNKSGINTIGPVSTEKAFNQKISLIICHYHDQAMVPLKLLYGMKLVNLTCGLPFVRTSPAHGVAYDIAGRNCADPTSMIEAIKLAIRLTKINPSYF